VRILRGPFVGIKGEIKNFKTHRVVVVKLDGLGLANVITRVPKKDLEFYDGE
jgi:transcription antitermination factor NusG